MPTIQEFYADLMAAPRDFLGRHAVFSKLDSGNASAVYPAYFTCVDAEADFDDVSFSVQAGTNPALRAMQIRVYLVGVTQYAAVERETFLPCQAVPAPPPAAPGAPPYDLIVTPAFSGCTLAHILDNPAGPLLCHVHPGQGMSGEQLERHLRRPHRMMAQSNRKPSLFGREDYGDGTYNVIGIRQNGRWRFFVQSFAPGNLRNPAGVSQLRGDGTTWGRRLAGILFGGP